MKFQILILFAFFSLSFANCDDTNNSPNVSTGCGSEIIIDNNYDTTTGDDFSLVLASISGNCLTTTVQYSGGCGDELVSFQLLGSTAAFPVSIPAMLETKIILDDNDDCEAWITKEIDFDLTPLEEAGYNNINVTIEGWNETLEYSF